MSEKTDLSPAHSDPSADWYSIPTPSDGLTLGQLRRMAGGNIKDAAKRIETLVHNLLVLEWEVGISARMRFEKPFESSISEKLAKMHVKELAELYSEIGLAAGQHEAERVANEYFSKVIRFVGGERERS